MKSMATSPPHYGAFIAWIFATGGSTLVRSLADDADAIVVIGIHLAIIVAHIMVIVQTGVYAPCPSSDTVPSLYS
jgi:hypothetical protein